MTLFTLAQPTPRDRYLRIARTYFFVVLFCAAFGAIYEAFSFGVFSFFMLYAFAIPMLLGLLPAILLASMQTRLQIPNAASRLWRAGIATWTVGALFRGVLDIYGTGSPLGRWYLIGGGALLSLAAIHAILKNA